MAKSTAFCSRKGRKLRRPTTCSSEAIGTGDLLRMSATAGGIPHVELEPGHVELLDGARDADIALGLEVHVAVEVEIHLRPRALAEGAQGRDDTVERVALEVERGVRRLAAIALHLARQLAVDQMEDVGLETLEAARLNLGAEFGDVVGRAHRLHPELLAGLDAVGAAVRPVDLDAIAHRTAEERVDRQVDATCRGCPRAPSRSRHWRAARGHRDAGSQADRAASRSSGPAADRRRSVTRRAP